MSFSVGRLLIHSEAVPQAAREALRGAYAGGPEGLEARLEKAAKILHRETGLACGDVRELVGLSSDGPC